MKHALSLLALLLATPATAEFVIEEGAFFVYARDYDHRTNSYTDAPPEGQKDGCFVITKADLPAKTIDFVLVSGSITPWWADGETYQPGFKNAFVPAIGFMENNPEADWTDLLHTMLRTVPACPAPAS